MTSAESDDSRAVGWKWLRLILADDDFDAAWRITHPNLRLCWIQGTLWTNRDKAFLRGVDLDQLAAALVANEPTNPHWPAMRASLHNEAKSTWSFVDFETWGSTRANTIAPNLELVLFRDTGGEVTTWKPDEAQHFLPLLMRWENGEWMVAGFHDQEPTPGWPPVFPTGRIDWT